jgi:hypothetical protein
MQLSSNNDCDELRPWRVLKSPPEMSKVATWIFVAMWRERALFWVSEHANQKLPKFKLETA